MSTINIRLTQIFSVCSVPGCSKAFLSQSVLKNQDRPTADRSCILPYYAGKLFLFYFGNNASANGTAA
ncbi:hypothetical protein, partial [uncultured Phascolarctobacterium sp.]|uniref:hypothetical protein n=1 Tax=uncultured Phascolarctobacterium sp. TaxID=512296 RepID=UPI00260E7FDC